MTPAALFSAANLLALTGWLALAFNAWRRREPMLWPARLVPVALALLYLVTVVPLLAAGAPDFGKLESVQALFADSRWALAGWVHYLAFDLLVGGWQVREAAARHMPRAVLLVCLFLTFMFGPVGWLLFLAARRLGASKEISHAS